jgi:hypothetical protein
LSPPKASTRLQDVGAGFRLGHHFDIRRVGQHLLQAFTHDAVVVADEDFQGVHGWQMWRCMCRTLLI